METNTLILSKTKVVNKNIIPSFIDINSLTINQLDPDYRLKMLQKLYSGMNTISCSKCHHCR